MRTTTTGTRNNEIQAVESSNLRNKIVKIYRVISTLLKYYIEPKNAVLNQKTSIKSLTYDNDVTIKRYQQSFLLVKTIGGQVNAKR